MNGQDRIKIGALKMNTNNNHLRFILNKLFQKTVKYFLLFFLRIFFLFILVT